MSFHFCRHVGENAIHPQENEVKAILTMLRVPFITRRSAVDAGKLHRFVNTVNDIGKRFTILIFHREKERRSLAGFMSSHSQYKQKSFVYAVNSQSLRKTDCVGFSVRAKLFSNSGFMVINPLGVKN